MRYTKTFIPTVKQVPADAEIISHQLMLRAGFMRKLASGTYAYLPAGWKILRKIMDIVRQEMDAAGALEITVPMVQPMEIWEKTGRNIDYGETLGRFTDRHNRQNVLTPTAEEAVTTLAAGEINSYKQLPVNFYQINLKYRDEFRPRFGVLRSREFIMKDAYSFDIDQAGLDKSYKIMYNAYCRIFARCGLPYVIVLAESGEMGGSGSHQFTIPCQNGEDTIVYTEDNSRAWNIAKAPVDPLPAQKAAAPVGPARQVHTPGVGSIESVCALLKAEPRQMIKTLIYSAGTDIIAAIVRGDHELNPEKLTQLFDGRHIELADEDTILKATGAAVGFAGPVGIAEKVHAVVIDHAVAAMAVGIAGANKTDYHITDVVPARDFALEGPNIKIADVRMAVPGDTCSGDKLLFKKGIEVGQVFKLGTKYSVKLGAKFIDADSVEKPCLMGCYGIGINRILASAIEVGNDKNGMILPISIAPWEVIITPAGFAPGIVAAAEKMYSRLLEKNIDILLDDRDVRIGVKFNDADLLGIPVRITVGEKSLAENRIEVKLRRDQCPVKIDIEKAPGEILRIVDSLKAELKGSDTFLI